MKKYLFIVLSVSFGWGQVEEGISYYESGLKKHQRPYDNRVANGKWIHWYENGQKWIEGNYKDGLQVGNWNTWYMNGQKSIEGAYKNNERNGVWTFYKEDGTVYEVKEY
tara:strand:+ start:64 stop:390 length:327 start_codon:yes stop_codon:yes gene_type:complete